MKRRDEVGASEGDRENNDPHVTRPFPDNWPQIETRTHNPNLYRLPKSLNKHLKSQNLLSPPSNEIFSSNSAISISTIGECKSPSRVWNSAKTLRASSLRPRAYSHRGDSQQNRMNSILVPPGTHWIPNGIRQELLF
jgi:hypothetical protein